MYYRISDAIDAIEWQAQQLNILDSDKEILERALASDELLQGVQKKIKEERKERYKKNAKDKQ